MLSPAMETQEDDVLFTRASESLGVVDECEEEHADMVSLTLRIPPLIPPAAP